MRWREWQGGRRPALVLAVALMMMQQQPMASPAGQTRQAAVSALAPGAEMVLADPAQALPAPVQAALQSQGLPAQSLSVVVMARDGGPARLAWNTDTSRAPASTIKLVTTLVALEQLGPAYRWTTEFLAEAAPVDGVLGGPLYVRSDGDPDFTAERLEAALRELRAIGVHTLDGDLVLDRRVFEPARPERVATAFDDTPDAYYNLVPDALLLNGNLLFLQLRSDTRQVQATVVAPAVAGLRIDTSGLQLVDAPCTQAGAGWQPPVAVDEGRDTVLRLQGRFPRDCTARLQTISLERNRYWQVVAGGLWQQLGGRWAGRVRDGAVPAGAVSLLQRRSDPLADIVRRANKASDNAMARLLYLSLGAQRLQGLGGPTAPAAAEVVRAWFARRGLSAAGLEIHNGSGLSRDERMTAAQLAEVLRAGSDSDWAPEFESSLPIAGLDGTMRRRLRDSEALGRARLKSGGLRDVLGVAGYVRDRARQNWIVVVLVNDPGAQRARPVLDAVIEWVVTTPSRPGAAAQ